MNPLDTLTTLLGWCTVINIGILIGTSILLALFHGPISRLHAWMFGVNEADLARAYFQYLAHCKIALYVFNLVPYIALKLIT